MPKKRQWQRATDSLWFYPGDLEGAGGGDSDAHEAPQCGTCSESDQQADTRAVEWDGETSTVKSELVYARPVAAVTNVAALSLGRGRAAELAVFDAISSSLEAVRQQHRKEGGLSCSKTVPFFHRAHSTPPVATICWRSTPARRSLPCTAAT